MFKKILPYILIILLPLLIHAPIWLGTIDFFSGDGSDLIPYVYGTKLLQYQTMRDFGEIALWNPYFFFGQPTVGNIQYALFYPLNLLFLLISFFKALWLYHVLHMIVAGLGAYLLSRHTGSGKKGSLLTACLFMVNGRLLYYINAGWIDHFGSICWLPFIVLLSQMVLERTTLLFSVLLAMALSMSFLAGTPQYTLLAICLFALQWVQRFFSSQSREERFSLLFRSLVAGLLFALLISVQLFPTFEQAGLSSRVFFTGASQGFHFNWEPQQWFRIFFRPEFLGHDFAWELCAYIGIGGLVLSLPGLAASRKNLSLALIWGIIPLVISLGPAFPPAAFVIKSVPGMSLLTSSSRYLIFTILILCLAAGQGLDKVIQSLESGSFKMQVYLVLAGVGLGVSGLLIPLYDQGSNSPTIRFWISLALFFSLVGFYFWRKSPASQVLLICWLIGDPLLLATDILKGGHLKNDLHPPASIIAALKNHPDPVRIATIQPEELRDNLLNPFDDWLSSEYRIGRAGGYDPLAMLRTLQFLTRMDGTGEIRAAMWGFRPWSFARPALYNIAGITHLIASKPLENPQLKLVATDTITMPHFHGGSWKNQPIYLYANKGALPRAFFRPPGSRDPVTPLEISPTSPNHLRLRFNVKQPGLVVISESFHSGWVAAGQHAPVDLQPFLNAFIAFKVAAGEHDILLEFSPQSFRLGRLLTLLGLLLSGVVLLFEKVRMKRQVVQAAG